jgi:uncharacterized protein (TIGR02145 family)
MNTKLVTILLLVSAPAVYSQPSGILTDMRDGKTYSTVTLGDQTWMSANLAYLPAVYPYGDSQFDSTRYYVYGNQGYAVEKAVSSPYYLKYGALYNFEAAKTACPKGWHLPSDQEWKELETFLGLDSKELDRRDWRAPGSLGEKALGQAGLHLQTGGCRGYGGFESEGFCGYYWTSSSFNADNAWRRTVCSGQAGISRQEERRYFGCSVRCIKDQNSK